MAETYVLLRRIEDVLHLYENRQTFNLTPQRARLAARCLGYADEGVFLKDLGARRRACRRIFERVFYRS